MLVFATEKTHKVDIENLLGFPKWYNLYSIKEKDRNLDKDFF